MACYFCIAPKCSDEDRVITLTKWAFIHYIIYHTFFIGEKLNQECSIYFLIAPLLGV